MWGIVFIFACVGVSIIADQVRRNQDDAEAAARHRRLLRELADHERRDDQRWS
jgi:hypothetical protein